MKLLAYARMGTALVLYLLAMVFVIWPSCLVKRASMAAQGFEPAERRRVNASHPALWGTRLARMVRAVTGFRLRVRLPEGWDRRPKRPRIYLSNHVSVLDALIMPVVEVPLGDADIRWVIKRSLLRVPFLGRVMSECGYAEVLRRKDARGIPDEERRRLNVEIMDTYMRLAREDGVSVGLFPEGQRFTESAPGARRRRVGELMGKASFRKLCEELPDHEVVSITVLWPPGIGGKTVFDVAGFCDRTVEVVVEIHPHVRGEDADAFLESEWDKKEELLGHLSD